MSSDATPVWSSLGALSEPSPQGLQGLRVGRFVLAEELGRGGMGVVYRAWDPQLGREVALKTLSAGRLASVGERMRILREARAVASLAHPNIVPLYDCLEEDGLVFLAMRLVRGPSLATVLRQGGPLRPEEAARIAVKVARALAHAHGQGLVHRDVKPANLLMEDGEPHLTDFGLARIAGAEGLDLTREGQLLGTPAYMAPEQIREGGRGAVPASDQYALGVVLDEMLRGAPPFSGDTPAQLFAAVLERRRPPLPATVPRELARVVERALEVDPARRFASVAEMGTALERWIEGERVFSRRDELTHSARRMWAGGRVVMAVLLAGGLLLGVDRFALGMWRAREDAAREARAEQRRIAMEAAPPEEADTLFEAFVSLPEVQDTPALSRAWLARGERLWKAGDRERAFHAMTTAYALAPDEDTQTSALLVLARTLRESDRLDALGSAVRLLRAHLASGSAPLRPLERDLAASTLDLDRAIAMNDDPDLVPLLAGLREARSLHRSAELVIPWDIDGDGVDELGFYEAKPATMTMVRTGGFPLAPLATYEVPAEPPIVARDEAPGPALAVMRGEGQCELVIPRGEGLEVLRRWACGSSSALATGDLDGDGKAELYHADQRTLRRTELEGESPWRSANASLEEANSEIRSLLVADLDQDGRRELAVAAGGWGAYDLRILAGAGDDGELRTEARTRIGEVWSLAQVRTPSETLLAVTQEHDPALPLNRRVFGDGPQGGAQGVYLFAWRDGRLGQRGFLPWPTPPTLPSSDRFVRAHGNAILSGDIDGDGSSEIALGLRDSWTALYRRRADGSWVSLLLADLYPLAFADLDHDGDDELLASVGSDGGVWAFGTGDELPPRTPETLRPRAAAPEDLEPDLRAAWERAEDLVDMGAVEAAADRFRALSRLAAGTPAAGAGLLRAASILEEDHRRAEAIALYLQAAAEPQLAPTALEAALRLERANHHFPEAIAIAERRLALPDPPPGLSAELVELHALVAPASIQFDFTGQTQSKLREPWVADSPFDFDLIPGGLRIASTGDTRILHLPVTRASGPARLELTVLPRRVDWGATLGVGLLSRSGEKGPSILVRTVGGGGIYHRFTMSCTDGPDGGGAGTLDGVRRTLVWELWPSNGEASCTQHDEAGVERGWNVYRSLQPIPEGDLDLVIYSQGEGGVADILLERVALLGFRLREEASPGPREDPLARVLALDAAGRGQAARVALADALDGDAGLADRLLLLSPDRFAPLLRDVLGLRYFEALARAHELIAAQHPEEDPVISASQRWLDGVERAPEDVRELLLTRRAEAWRRRGELGLAQKDIASALSPPGPRRAETWREAALIRAASGDDEGALEAVLAALKVAPSPEIFADRLSILPELARLKALPGWQLVREVQGEAVWDSGDPRTGSQTR